MRLAFVITAPVPTVLILDDVHETAAGSPGAAVLGELIGALPPHAHAVLSNRTAPPIEVARYQPREVLLDDVTWPLFAEIVARECLVLSSFVAGTRLAGPASAASPGSSDSFPLELSSSTSR